MMNEKEKVPQFGSTEAEAMNAVAENDPEFLKVKEEIRKKDPDMDEASVVYFARKTFMERAKNMPLNDDFTRNVKLGDSHVWDIQEQQKKKNKK